MKFVMKPFWGWICVILLLTACESEPTPFPAQIPTVTPDALVSAQTPISITPQATTVRYAIDPLLAHIPLALTGHYEIVSDDRPISPSDLGITYDIGIAPASAEGWGLLPISVSIGVIFRPDSAYSDILWRAIDPPLLIEQLGLSWLIPLHDGTTPATVLRTDLANMGKPDGFMVDMGIIGMMGEAQIQAQLGALFIQTRRIPLSDDNRLIAWANGDIDLMLVSWMNDAEKAQWVNLVGEAYLLPLYRFGIAYIARPDLNIIISDDGLPQVVTE
ncbi:MAG: hypothetical protein CUN52_03320 [Phototrophicales bacterium]|nr:MAG: hypothetical protein CUN52_03320 [Phototrophicales bacterium]